MQNDSTSPRVQALSLLAAVLGAKKTLDTALAEQPLTGSAPDQAFTRLLVMTVLRHLGQIDAVVEAFLATPIPPKRQHAAHALRLGAAQLLLLETPAHAAVGETVAALKTTKDRGLSGMVNAVLKRIAQEKPPLPDARANLPLMFKHRWKRAYGAEAVRGICEVAAQRPPLDCQRIGAEGTLAFARYPSPYPAPETLEGYAQGAFFVQDMAAGFPVRMLSEVKGMRVLDVCAAPGGKTAQLALAGAQVTALDRSASRMDRLRENMARLGLDVKTVVADALEWQPDAPFDAILLDAPCSATGTWRRHPEVMHLITQAQIDPLVALQQQLLARVWGWLKPGGVLVYCVCSLEPEEGEENARWFAAHMPDASPLAATAALAIPDECVTPEGWLRTLPCHQAQTGGMDGFFAAAWEKTR